MSFLSTSAVTPHVKAILYPIFSPVRSLLTLIYLLVQQIIVFLFKPHPPPDRFKKPYGRIAVIGGGLTGVSSAAHAIAHGFEVVLYEGSDRVGGIWSRENKTSGLQLNSLLYRFHPAVQWSVAFPHRDEILGQISKIWKEYKLEPRTRLNTPVTSVRRVPREGSDPDSDSPEVIRIPSPSQWYINEGEDGPFDAIIVTIGTCGKPKWINLEGMPEDSGKEKKGQQSDGSAQNGQEGRNAQNGEENMSKSKINNERKKMRKRRKQARQAEERGEQVETNGYDGSRSDDGSEDDDDADEEDESPSKVTARASYPQIAPYPPLHDEKEKGEPRNQPTEIFQNTVLHSSQLDSATADVIKGRTVVVIGSGASGVEAVETALSRGASKCIMLARDDKWIIPRNIIFDTLLSAQPFGREMPIRFVHETQLSIATDHFIWERFLRVWQYHGVEELVPKTPIFSGTPVVNDEFLNHVRNGKCVYIRGDTVRLTKIGVLVKIHERIDRGRGHKADKHDEGRAKNGHTKGKDKAKLEEIGADVVVLATGYEKPNINFLPRELFPEGYERPNLYLQNFSTEDWSVLMTNSAYMNAIGTVGHFHIGIYTRILLTLLLDPHARPTTKDMKLWVDVVRFIKRGASGGALGFFTYMELTIWLLTFHLFRPDRLRWLFFIMQGWGVPPENDRLLGKLAPNNEESERDSDP